MKTGEVRPVSKTGEDAPAGAGGGGAGGAGEPVWRWGTGEPVPGDNHSPGTDATLGAWVAGR